MRVVIAVVSTGVLIVACSGVTSLGAMPGAADTTGDGGTSDGPMLDVDGGPRVPPSGPEAIARLATATCRSLYECPATEAPLYQHEVAKLRMMFTSPDDCAQRIPSLWNHATNHDLWGWIARLDTWVIPAVEIGRATVDPAALDACVEATEQCVSPWRMPLGPCSKIFKGTTPEGDRCTANENCKEGQYCKRATYSACAGVCAPRVPVGSPCAESREQQCEEGAGCRLVADGGILCTRRVDIPPAFTTVTVDLDDVCDSDDTTVRRCKTGLYCQSHGSDASPTCRPPIAANAPCNSLYRDVCVPGHVCTGSVCEPVRLGAMGDECLSPEEFEARYDFHPCNPWLGLTCLPSGHCGPGGREQQPALFVSDNAFCLDGLLPTKSGCRRPIPMPPECALDE